MGRINNMVLQQTVRSAEWRRRRSRGGMVKVYCCYINKYCKAASVVDDFDFFIFLLSFGLTKSSSDHCQFICEYRDLSGNVTATTTEQRDINKAPRNANDCRHAIVSKRMTVETEHYCK